MYLPYIVLIGLLLTGSLLEVIGVRKEQMRWVRWFIVAFLLLFVGLRYNTGADWKMYTYVFDSIPIGMKKLGWEIGFVGLMKTFYYLFGNYYVLQFAATLFLLFAVNRLYSRYSSYPVLSISLFVFLFLFTILMAQVRQSIALGIVLLATPYIFDKKFLPFVVTVGIASLFHVSAVLALPLYFLNRPINKYVAVVFVVLAQCIYAYPEIIFNTMDLMSPIMPTRLEKLISVYRETVFAKKVVFGTGVYYMASVALCIITLLWYKREDNQHHFYSNALLATFVLVGLSNTVSILERFQPYYYAYAIVAFVGLLDGRIKSIAQKSIQSVCFCLVFAFFLLRIAVALTNTQVASLTGRPINYGYVPYYNLVSYPPEADERLDWFQKESKK